MKQGELDLRRDKNGQKRGGHRKGAGRPPKGRRSSERHEVRPALEPSEPQHIVSRVLPRAGSLRRRDMYAAVRKASIVVTTHDDFRIVHLSIQRTHLHLIVEARTRTALAKGMQGFLISAARGINAALSRRARRKLRGCVFGDRYHARALTTPREVRNCIAYVLNNWRHHREDRGRTWTLDPFASGVAFGGWKGLERAAFAYRPPPTYAPLVVWFPKTWLLSTGWRKRGLVGELDVPGGDE